MGFRLRVALTSMFMLTIWFAQTATAAPYQAEKETAPAQPQAQAASGEQALSREQMKNFLRTAKIINSKGSKIGVTDTYRLTLSDGTLTHDGSFQYIDEHKMSKQLASGRTEFNFVDSYKYNIAGSVLAEMLGLDDLVPVYVERNWNNKVGSLSWWLPVQMDDLERQKRKIEPPDQAAWNKQMFRIRVFDQLIYDTDVNYTNILISPEWKLYRIDFSRAFRAYKKLQNVQELERCDRQLLDKLKALDRNQLTAATKHLLSKSEVDAVMARRDEIVTHIQQLVAQKGESDVLY